MDLGTGLAILGSKDIVVKVLGPTADYIGKELELFTQNRIENLKKIFSLKIHICLCFFVMGTLKSSLIKFCIGS